MGLPEPTATVALQPNAWEPGLVPADEELLAFIGEMPLEDKVGQMMMVGIPGQSLSGSPQLETLIADYRVGGIVLLERNAHDPRQVAQLLGEAQALATTMGSNIPLFVSINHEGGNVVRITEGVTGFPGNMGIAASGRADYAHTAAAMAADELRAMGINMNLAPVLDVNDDPLNPIIGARSFGESPVLAASLGGETIRGFQEHGVIAVAKHFPGHGSTTVDSHVGLPVINKPESELLQTELPPFEAAVDSGIEAIMTAHIVVPAWEPEPRLPATLSSNILSGILRTQMGFDGIVVTDSLGMGGVIAGRGQAGAAVEAVKAGVDVVLSTGPLEAQMAIHQALVAAVQSGQITQQRIDQSILRILRVKHKYRLFGPPSGADLDSVDWAGNQAFADQAALAAVTLYRNNAGLVPFRAEASRLLVLSPHELPPAATKGGTLLGQELRQRGFQVTELVFNLNQTGSRDAAYVTALQAAPEHDLVVFGEWQLVRRYANRADTWQEELISALVQSGKPVVMISWHDPGAILRVPQVSTYIVAYGNTVAQVKAVSKLLTGESASQGTLPMTLTRH
jgi:beta-N-acetylhexosaminidase